MANRAPAPYSNPEAHMLTTTCLGVVLVALTAGQPAAEEGFKEIPKEFHGTWLST